MALKQRKAPEITGDEVSRGTYGFGGAAGANMEYPEWQAGMLGYAMHKDDGAGAPKGRRTSKISPERRG